MVGIDVAADVHAAGAGIVDELQHGVDLGPVLTAPHLDVRDLHPDPAVLPMRMASAIAASTVADSPCTWEKYKPPWVAIERARPTSSSVVAYALGG